jgi:hypothetical protein
MDLSEANVLRWNLQSALYHLFGVKVFTWVEQNRVAPGVIVAIHLPKGYFPPLEVQEYIKNLFGGRIVYRTEGWM